LELRERLLERAVADARRQPEHAVLGRGRDHRDMSAQALVVVVAAVGELDPEVLAWREVEMLAAEVEDDQLRPLGDLPLLLDRRAHRTVSVANRAEPSRGEPFLRSAGTFFGMRRRGSMVACIAVLTAVCATAAFAAGAPPQAVKVQITFTGKGGG